MKTRIRVFLPVAVAVVFVLSGAAYAQSYRPMAPFYIGIFGGYAAPEDMTWRSSVTGERADLALDESGMMGIKFGYVIPQARALAVELEWNYMFDQSIPPQRIGGWTESGDDALGQIGRAHV